MHKIIQINDSVSLDELRKALAQAHSVRLNVDGNQVAFKINGGMWSSPMGQLDPECQAAQQLPYRSLSELGSMVRDETR